jgi:hypothetical protein
VTGPWVAALWIAFAVADGLVLGYGLGHNY